MPGDSMRAEGDGVRGRLEPLGSEWAEKASRELNESPKTIEESLINLRTLLEDETTLNVRPDDAFLLRFLRARKFDCPKAYTMLRRYYLMKLESPELFKTPRPSDKLHILKMQAQTVLKDRDDNGSRVYIFRVDKCDTSQVTIEDVFSTNVLALEHMVREPETQIAGLTVLVDMTGFSLQQHAKFLSPYYARRTVDVIQETFPLRFKGFHVINQPFYFDAVFALLKPFLKEKIRQRIFLHGKDRSSLHSFVNKAILPSEYGGSQGEFDNTWWREELLKQEDEFVEMETYGYQLPRNNGRELLQEAVIKNNQYD